MGNATMGKVLVTALIENLEDLFSVNKGQMTASEVRRVEVIDALVDSGASGLLLPMRYVTHLGLAPFRTRTSLTVGGIVSITSYRAVQLTIQGRDYITDVSGVSDDLPVIIGQLPLEAMDWVIDMKGQKLIGNPEHGGEWMSDNL